MRLAGYVLAALNIVFGLYTMLTDGMPTTPELSFIIATMLLVQLKGTS